MKPKTWFKIASMGLILAGAYLPGTPSGATPLSSQSSSLDVCGAPSSMPAAREKARRLVRQIREDLAAVEDQIRNVPFVADVEAGTASIEQIAAVVAEEYSIIRSDLNSFKQMAARWDTPQGSHFFGDLAFGEALALPLVLDFGANVGLSESDLAAYEPRPKGRAIRRASPGSPPTRTAPPRPPRSWSTSASSARTWRVCATRC